MAIAAMLALSTSCADAAKRQVGKAPLFAAQGVKVVPIHAAPEPSYWMYRRCSPGARAADPYTVCFPSNTVRPYLGRDPDATFRCGATISVTTSQPVNNARRSVDA